MTFPFAAPLASPQQYLLSGTIQITEQLDTGNLLVAGQASNNTNNHTHADPTVTLRGTPSIFAGTIMPVQARAVIAQAWTSSPLNGDQVVTISVGILSPIGDIVSATDIVLDATNTAAGKRPVAVVMSDAIEAGGIVFLAWTKDGTFDGVDHQTFASFLMEG